MGTYLIHETDQCCTHRQTFPKFKMFFCVANVGVYKTKYPSVHTMHTNDVYNYNYSIDFMF